MNQIKIKYHEINDIIEIEGIRYSAHMFREFAHGKPNTWVKLGTRHDGTVNIITPNEPMQNLIQELYIQMMGE